MKDLLKEFIGKTAISITGMQLGGDQIDFNFSDGSKYRFYHSQDCCEYVRVEDVIGDFQDLIGSPITMAEEISNFEEPKREERYDDSHTWTFYKFATLKGYVDVRWLGESNGYYSESVDLIKL